MNRSKVIVHMYVSIDGKIDGSYGSTISGSYYSDELFRLSNADANQFKCMQLQVSLIQVGMILLELIMRTGFQIFNKKHGIYRLVVKVNVAGNRIISKKY